MNPELLHAVELAATGEGHAARQIVVRLAGEGDPDALYTWADMHWRGVLVDRDWPEALRLFQAAEAAGNSVAGQVVTNLMASGVTGRRDWPGAVERLAREAESDHQRAFALGLIEEMDLDEAGDPRQPPAGEQVLSTPDLRLFPRLFSQPECLHLRSLAEPLFGPSLVTGPNLEQLPDPIRTSDGASIHHLIEDPAVHALNRRLAMATGSTYPCGEVLLVLRYRPGQHYLNHIDALPGLANQRVRTVLVYLNEGYQGGQTQFPAVGYAFRGQTGDAIVFRNVTDDGQRDQLSIHAGAMVTMGNKYLASRWIRERAMFDESGPVGD